MDRENDGGVVPSLSGGWTVVVTVDSNAYDADSALVTLNFHSGSDATGPVIATATVRTGPRPLVPPPTSLSAPACNADGVDLAWDARDGAARYRVQYQLSTETQWTLASDAINTNSYSVTGLDADSAYRFQVGAYGDGANYSAAWGGWSASVDKSTCNAAPVFAQDSYSFSVLRSAQVGDAVGEEVTATDPDSGDTVTYSITSGNSAGKFAIGSSTGAITVDAALGPTDTSYTLTVQAQDSHGATDTATVTVTVGGLVPDEPINLFATPTADGGFTLSWDSVTGATIYEYRYRVVGSPTWTVVQTTSTGSTLALADPACPQTYEFQVRVRATLWSDWSGPETAACNAAPVFEQDTYAFTLNRHAGLGASIGTVTATDANAGEILTYSITAGNSSGDLHIGTHNGIIEVNTFRLGGTSSYTLTVRAQDNHGATGTATVTITVENPCHTILGTQTGTRTLSGTWVSACPSPNYSGTYAHFYTFTLAQESIVQIDLASTEDPVLYLLAGSGTGGAILGQDYEADTVGGGYNARISQELAAGDYTVEATTFLQSRTGNFDLTIVQADMLPGAPDNLTVIPDADTGFILSWDPVTGATGYEYGYRLGSYDMWTNQETTLTEATLAWSHSACPLVDPLQFQVRAEVSLWGDWSEPVTAHCNGAPFFDRDSYSFEVSEASGLGAPVGRVTATDPNIGDTVTYSISVRNDGASGSSSPARRSIINPFGIGSGGAITVNDALNSATKSSYALDVRVSDPWGATATASVNVTVTASTLPRPTTPTNFLVSTSTVPTQTTITLNWDPVAGASLYEMQSSPSGAAMWTTVTDPVNLSSSTVSVTVSGLTCASAYEFQVRALGDGTTAAAVWGNWAPPAMGMTANCSEVSIAGPDYGAREGTGLVFELTAKPAPDEDIVVAYLLGGTAIKGDDYQDPAPGSTTPQITIPAGTLSYAFSISTVLEADDPSGELPHETVEITLVPFPLEYALYQIPVSPARRSRASWNPQLEVTFQYRQDYLEPVLVWHPPVLPCYLATLSSDGRPGGGPVRVWSG